MKLDLAPDARDPHRGVKRFSDYQGDVRASCEVLVVGSGPGGAVVAKELAEAGRDVILLEEGPPFGAADLRQEAGESMARTLRESGTRATRGNAFLPTMQAIALGGGSLINSAICARAPAFVFDTWAERTGVKLTRAALDPHYQRVEDFLFVGPTPLEVQGERNLLFKQGCDALGISSEPTWRNVRGCKGSGECFTGCRNGAKQSTDVSYVPAAIRAGARVYSSVRAEHVLHRGRRVTGVRGHVVEPFTWREAQAVEIAAEVVVLAAGTMATPVILQKSELARPGGWVGKDLQVHPGLALMALYDRPDRSVEGRDAGVPLAPVPGGAHQAGGAVGSAGGAGRAAAGHRARLPAVPAPVRPDGALRRDHRGRALAGDGAGAAVGVGSGPHLPLRRRGRGADPAGAGDRSRTSAGRRGPWPSCRGCTGCRR